MYWQVRWAKNAIFGRMPFGDGLRRFKRAIKPYSANINDWALEEGLILIELLREAGADIHGARVLEIGSGWHPVIPVLFSICGAESVITVDMQPLMDQTTFDTTIVGLKSHLDLISKRTKINKDIISNKLSVIENDFKKSLKDLNIEYYAPCNLIETDRFDDKFDIVMSRAVLEHIPVEVLTPLFTKVFALLKPGGWTSHAVDNSDHYSHVDKRLSRINFLRFSDDHFNFLNRFNPLDFQNRLRHPEYEKIFRECGFEMVISRSEPEKKAIADLKELQVSPRFKDFSPESLAQLDSYFVARRPVIGQ